MTPRPKHHRLKRMVKEMRGQARRRVLLEFVERLGMQDVILVCRAKKAIIMDMWRLAQK
jgi:hypothetical protein